ncbi:MULTISPECIES: hypothetical protein [unclassified Streptomyces]|uniref:hypothetical protein n=1 Tax=unclassified Streptomyces TaxID=2593676 RepID=UPI0036EDEC9C
MIEVGLGDWPYDDPPPPTVRPNPGGRLAALRRNFYEASLDARRISGRQVCVATYVRAPDRTTIEAHRGKLLGYADRMGWRAAPRHFTDVLPVEAQSSLSEAGRYVGGGYAHGILMLGRSSMASSDEEYEALLHWLHARCSFIAFIPPALMSKSPSATSR